MKFDRLKEFTNYIDLMGQHLLKVSEKKISTFVYDEVTYKSLYDRFEEETAENFTNGESHLDLNRCYRPLLIPYVRKWDQLLNRANIQPEDYIHFPDELNIPIIYKLLKENRNVLHAFGSRFHYKKMYPVFQKPCDLVARKKRTGYQSPTSSSDPIIHFNKEFIEIEIMVVKGRIEKLRYLENILTNYLKFKIDAKLHESESYYFNKVIEDLDSWLRGEQEKIISEIRKEDAKKKFPFLSIDGLFHYNDELSFQIKDYFGEKCYSESTFTFIRSYFEKQFTGKSETERITEATKLAIIAALSVSEEFHKACDRSLSRLVITMNEQAKVNQIEKELIDQIESVMQDETIEYAEAYKRLSDISFQIEKKQKELFFSIKNPNVNADLNTADDLCRVQTFRYADLKNSKRFSNQKQATHPTEKIKTKLTVDELAYLFRTLHDEGLIICPSKSKLAKTISLNFETTGKQSLSADSIRNKMATPDLKTIESMHTVFVRMMQKAGKEREK